MQFEDGKMIPASKYFSSEESASLELTDEEKKMAEEIKVCTSHDEKYSIGRHLENFDLWRYLWLLVYLERHSEQRFKYRRNNRFL